MPGSRRLIGFSMDIPSSRGEEGRAEGVFFDEDLFSGGTSSLSASQAGFRAVSQISRTTPS
jgi:hypothetical protein